MQRLLDSISNRNSAVKEAIQVVAVFRDLADRGSDPQEILRTASSLAGRQMGLSGPDGRTLLSAEPEVSAERPAADGQVERWHVGPRGAPGGYVWIERGDEEDVVALMILEKAAELIERSLGRDHSAPLAEASPQGGGYTSHLTDQVLWREVLDENASADGRHRAASLRGLDTAATALVVVCTAPPVSPPPADTWHLLGGERHTTAVVLRPGPTTEVLSPLPLSARVAIGPRVPVDQLPSSLAQARQLLPLTSSDSALSRVVDAHELGVLTLFATAPLEQVGSLPDARGLLALLNSANGRSLVSSLEAVVRLGSLRAAAAALHMHHSTVADHVEKAEAALGYPGSSTTYRPRTRAALLAARRLLSEQEEDETRP